MGNIRTGSPVRATIASASLSESHSFEYPSVKDGRCGPCCSRIPPVRMTTVRCLSSARIWSVVICATRWI